MYGKFVLVWGLKKMDAGSVLNFVLVLFKYLILVFIVLIIGLSTFQWLTSIDEVVTSGEVRGFKIGTSQVEVFNTLVTSSHSVKYKARVVLFDDERKRIKAPDIFDAKLNDEEFYLFKGKNEWTLFLESIYFIDEITFSFCDDKLCEVWRRRSYIEFP